jgi:hypothetical protein
MPDLAAAADSAEVVGSVVAVLEADDLGVVDLEVVDLGVVHSGANSEVEELGVETLAEVASEASASLVGILEPDGIGAPAVVRAASARAETLPVTARTSRREMGEWHSDSKTGRIGAARTSKTAKTRGAKINRTDKIGVARISKTAKMHMMTTGMITGMAATIQVAAGTDGVDIMADWRWVRV